MKNWLSLVTLTLIRTSRMTRLQQIILIGSIQLPDVLEVFTFTSFRIIRRPNREKISMSDPAGKMIEPIKIRRCIFVIREVRAKVNITKFHQFFICSFLYKVF